MNYRSSFPSSQRSSKARPPSRRNFGEDDEEDEDEYEDEYVELPESDDEENDNDEDYTGYQRAVEANYRNRNPKKRRVEELNPTYEFRPRGVHSIRASQPEWNEHSTYVLLDAWGERFLQLGRSSLRSDDWSEVAERVSEVLGSDFGVSECRTRLNVLKGKYKKEKAKLEAIGGGSSNWVYFKKIDMLMTLPPRLQQQCGLACGVDSGEFVFMDPKVYLEHSNALDEMRDSPGNSDSEGEEDEEDDRRGRRKGEFADEVEDLESYRMLSESIKRVGEIYEKIEDSKRQHMMELETMRMEFQRDMELQKKEMVERTRAEIERIRLAKEEEEEEEEEEDEEQEENGDCSADTTS